MSHSVRTYRGLAIPWKVHDCTEANNCPFCRKQKRAFVAAWKLEHGDPPHHREDPGPIPVANQLIAVRSLAVCGWAEYRENYETKADLRRTEAALRAFENWLEDRLGVKFENRATRRTK